MADLISLQAHKDQGTSEENEKLARTLEDAAKRARRGDFQSVAWFGLGRDGYGAHFGWHKFGASLMPLIGVGFTALQEMANSPPVPLEPLDDDPPKEPA